MTEVARRWVVNVGEELRHPGTQHPVTLAGPIPGIGLQSARVPDDAEVAFDGVVEAQGGASVVLHGVARAPWVGECRRCLQSTQGEVEVDLREVFEPHPTEGETFPLIDEQIDVLPVLTEALTLALPLAPLCGDDCAGPDPDGHPVGGADDDEDAEPRRDPRWAALDQLRLDG